MRRNRGTSEQEKVAPQLEVGQWVYVRRPTADTLDTGVSSDRWKVQEIRTSGVIKQESEQGEERLVYRTECMKAGQQYPGWDMAAGGQHGDQQPSAGGNSHVLEHGGSQQEGTKDMQARRNREITSVYQRRQKRVQPAAEHATTVIVESFFRMII